MKKPTLMVFIIACLVVCLIPSIGMFFCPTTQRIGNEQSLPFPSFVKEDGSFNTDILSDLGKYFEQHFAFRSESITADAAIQSKIFGVSNLDSVVVGKDGWLYYASTLDDYMGRGALTEQQMRGLAHNLALVQKRVEEHDARFLFTVAPNKNTLYPEHMPSYYLADGDAERNRDRLCGALAQSSVNYCDLFAAFETQPETLYFKRDSHWNNKGALIASNEILDKLGKEHDDYAEIEPEQRIDFVGDLHKMLYPAAPEPELNFYYGAEDAYDYVTNTNSVEDSLIRTENAAAQGTLFMYRDSFGNLLLPYFASAFNEAVFSKSFPVMLDIVLQQYEPNDVVFEIAERNISWFLTQPPVMRAPVVEASALDLSSSNKCDLTVRECENSPLYLEVSGLRAGELESNESPVYIYVHGSGGQQVLYECYNSLTDQQENAFLAYLDAGEYDGLSRLTVSVVVRDTVGFRSIGSNTVEIEREREE